MRTIAEFVENEQVFDRVRDLGVDYVQGHYLGKPQSVLQTASVVADDNVSASVA
jgi:EAL domain-containing protein (putative c-di-GMP-specific phosphodiesterase class I)